MPEMAKPGYHVVSVHEYDSPHYGIVYEKVTYELVDPPK